MRVNMVRISRATMPALYGSVKRSRLPREHLEEEHARRYAVQTKAHLE